MNPTPTRFDQAVIVQDMATRTPNAPRHTGLLLAGLLAIPFASVSIAAQLGDIASTTDPRDALAGGLALLVGVALGLVVRRLVATVDARVRGAVRLVAAALRPLPGAIAEIVRVTGRSLDEATMPRLVFVPAETGRRGPPIRVR
ncbi:MAG: hypothetical protein EBY61_09930 [Actinobacteria bacterium]|nr:hypothetical protein [Actinomycetota bacterium]